MIFRNTRSSKGAPILEGVPERRTESRLGHIRAVAIVPERDGWPLIARAVFGLTGDISQHGLSVYLAQVMPEVYGSVIVALWIDGQAHLIRASVQDVKLITAKVYRLSLKQIGPVPPDTPGMSALLQLAQQLRAGETSSR
jgi:hypothetical protein